MNSTKNTNEAVCDSKDAYLWYAVRTTYKRELKIQQILNEKGIENFIPVRIDDTTGVQKIIPVMQNVIFIRSSRNIIDQLKTSEGVLSSLRYIINMDNGKLFIIPDEQISNFMLISSTMNDSLIYMSASEIGNRTGERYIITGGDYKNAVGEIIRVKGDRRFVVRIVGFVIVATEFIHPKYLMKI